MEKKPIFFHRHRTDEYVDEITIKVTPRFKTSGISGDEWRVSSQIQLKRKGHVIWEDATHTVQDALAKLPWLFRTFTEHPEFEHLKDDDKLCTQPGCSEPAVNFYRVEKERHGHGSVMAAPSYGEYRQGFCARHSERGDSDLEDCDKNLTLVEGDGKTRPNPKDESPAIFGGIIGKK